MAKPQTENGYMKLSNEIMEALARFYIPGRERQLMDIVLRKTYGYHKKEDKISISQFAKASLLPESKVCRGLNNLVKKRVLIKGTPKSGTGHTTKYRFNKDYEQWLNTPNSGSRTPKGGNRGLPTVGDTKDNIQKILNTGAKAPVENIFNRKLLEYPIQEIYDFIKVKEPGVVGRLRQENKKNPQVLFKAYLEAKELGKPYINYIFKVYNNLLKKI